MGRRGGARNEGGARKSESEAALFNIGWVVVVWQGEGKFSLTKVSTARVPRVYDPLGYPGSST